MRRFLAYTALFCFALSLFVHLSAYIGQNWLEQFPCLFGLHILAIGYLFLLRGVIKEHKKSLWSAINFWHSIGEGKPDWLRTLVPVSFYYAIFNFLLNFCLLTSETTPRRLNGDYIYTSFTKTGYISVTEAQEQNGFWYPDEIVHLEDVPAQYQGSLGWVPISEKEYASRKQPMTRAFSGHWMAFFIAAAAFYYPSEKSKNKSKHGKADYFLSSS